MKYIITGGAGFIGSHLVDRLNASEACDVTVIDDLSSGKNRAAIQRLYAHDVSLPLSPVLLEGSEVLIHLAAKARVQPSIADPVFFNQTNVTGTLRMLWLAKRLGVRRFVFASSSSVYGEQSQMPLSVEQTEPRPVSPYGLQKWIGEQYCRLFSKLYGLDTVCLRFFNVYGSGMSHGQYAMVIQKFLDQRKRGEPLTIYGDGSHRRDFTWVGDVVDAILIAATREEPFGGMALNVGRGSNVSVAEWAEIVGGEVTHLPAVPEPSETLAAISRTKQELAGWHPTQTLQSWLASTR